MRVFKRPALDEFLVEASKVADLVLYTSAVEGYASEIVRGIDPTGTTFISILSRQHCRFLQHTGAYGKDLGSLGRPLERTVLLDDSVTSFMLQPDNGIPIRPFYGDPLDRGLVDVLPLLRRLGDEDDVRPALREKYGLRDKLLRRVQAMRSDMTRHM